MKQLILLCLIIFSPLAGALTSDMSDIHTISGVKKAAPAPTATGEKSTVSGSTLIKGVSAFLLERAEANLIHVFEHKIKDNEQFACYLPNTRKRLEYGNLQEWLMFPKDVFADTIKKDMEVFALRSLMVDLENRLNMSEQAEKLNNLKLEYYQHLVVLYQGERLPLNAVLDDKTSPEAKLVNGFYDSLLDIINSLRSFKSYTSVCDSPNKDLAEAKENLDGLINIDKKLKTFRAHFKKYAKDLRISSKKIQEFCDKNGIKGDCSTEEKASKLFVAKVKKDLEKRFYATGVGKFIKEAEAIKKRLKEAGSYTAMMIVMLDEVEKHAKLGDAEMQRLSRAGLFFANLTDSDNADAVKAVLKAYTLPPVSYYSKREYGYHINITSYLGLAHGSYDSDVPEPEVKTSIFAPIGLEVSRGGSSGDSVSIMLSPFDFGYPVNQRLNGNDEDAKLEDILAPSITLSYGFKDLPLTIGAGYQQGRYLPALGKNEDRALLFIAFDMPLWNIR